MKRVQTGQPTTPIARKVGPTSRQRESTHFSRGNNPLAKYTWTDVCQATERHVGKFQWTSKGLCVITARCPTGRQEGVSCQGTNASILSSPIIGHRQQRGQYAGRKMVERNWRIFKSWTTDAFKRFIEILGFVSQMMRNHHNPPKGCSWAGTFF